MNAKPSSSTSKNFIQMNKEKIAAMKSKNRTRSQELPLKSLPANPSLLSSSKIPGGTLKHISTVLPENAIRGSSTPTSQVLTSEKITEVIENTKNMIEDCVKALTPIKPSVARMSVIDEGLDSKSSQEEIKLDEGKTLETNDGENLGGCFEAVKKTPESRYKEYDVHQIVYSGSASDYVSPNEKNEGVKMEHAVNPLENKYEVENEDECYEDMDEEVIRELMDEIHRESILKEAQERSLGTEGCEEKPVGVVIDQTDKADNEFPHSEKSETKQQPRKTYNKSESGSQKSRTYNTRKNSSHKGEQETPDLPDSPKETNVSSDAEEVNHLQEKHPELMLRRSARLAHRKEVKQAVKEKEPVRRKKSKKHAGHKKKVKY